MMEIAQQIVYQVNIFDDSTSSSSSTSTLMELVDDDLLVKEVIQRWNVLHYKVQLIHQYMSIHQYYSALLLAQSNVKDVQSLYELLATYKANHFIKTLQCEETIESTKDQRNHYMNLLCITIIMLIPILLAYLVLVKDVNLPCQTSRAH